MTRRDQPLYKGSAGSAGPLCAAAGLRCGWRCAPLPPWALGTLSPLPACGSSTTSWPTRATSRGEGRREGVGPWRGLTGGWWGGPWTRVCVTLVSGGRALGFRWGAGRRVLGGRRLAGAEHGADLGFFLQVCALPGRHSGL